MRRHAFILIVTWALVGCETTAPLSNIPTGKTLGKNNISTHGGYLINTFQDDYHLNVGYGLTDSFDIHLQSEVKGYWEDSLGIGLKYALMQSKENGPALSLDGGIGSHREGHYYYAGGTISYTFGFVEPFSVLRYNASKGEVVETDLFQQNSNNNLITQTRQYGQATVGLSLHLNKHISFYTHGDYLTGSENNAAVGVGIRFKTG